MSRKRRKYWEERAARRELEYMAQSDEAFEEIRRAYDLAGQNIMHRIDSILRNAAKHGLDEQEAYIYRLELAGAAQAAINQEFIRLTGLEMNITSKHYAKTMSNAYYMSLFDLQQGTGLGFSFNTLPTKAIDTTLKEGWQGRDFKESVWRNTKVVAKRVQDIVRAGFMSGASIDTMANQLYAMNQEVNDKLRQGKFAAYRLIRTESNYFANQGELLSYREAGITHYDYLATLDLRTSEVCQELDGKTFPVANAVVGENYPPMHPFCRSTTVAHFDDKNLDELERRARDPVTGKTMLVPASMDYKEWYDNYVETMEENKTDDIDLKNDTINSIVKSGGGNMINIGASGAIPRSDYRRLDNHAKLFYAEVRKRTRDIEKIAHNTGFSVEDIKKIKDHIFFNEYDLGNKKPSRFDADYDMAVSWQRLTDGKNIQEMDLVMLNHELMEYGLMIEKGLSYREAHDITELKYNYAKYVKELNKKEGLL